ncbi:hypothetical protein M885DRAFT_574943 [Pelagophyceae sp. CCMP2097]|nr:hypothetical protein M885DRAFT_574943 [Pelagophyceae sp. CCMP2097]
MRGLVGIYATSLSSFSHGGHIHMNATGRVIVARLKTHLEVVYGGSAGKTRTPTGFIDLLIKAEIAAQLPVPPPPPGAP